METKQVDLEIERLKTYKNRGELTENGIELLNELISLKDLREQQKEILNKMSKNKKYYNLAEHRALTIPVILWRFCAYKTEKDYESGNYYFMKDFFDHTEMKVFSSSHSAKEKPLHPDYCSMYWKIETNAT